MKTPHFLVPALARPGAFGLQVAGSGAWLATDARIAETSEARRRGVLALPMLPKGQALVIVPSQGIHTFGMRFALDIVGVSRDGTVVSLKAEVPRRRLVFSWRAFAMVELEAGAIRSSGVRVGDVLSVAIPASGNIEQSSSLSKTS